MLSSSQLPSRQERQFLTTGGHGLTRMPNDDFCLFLIRVYPWLITPENIKKRRWRGCGRDGARCLSDGRGCRAATPPPVSVSEGGTNVVGLASRGSCPAEDGKAPDCGLRSALSLPIKLRALTIGEIHERPNLPGARRVFFARDFPKCNRPSAADFHRAASDVQRSLFASRYSFPSPSIPSIC